MASNGAEQLKIAYQKGFAAAKALYCKSGASLGKTPVAFLYNGVPLPLLPLLSDQDDENYQNLVIYESESAYSAYALTKESHVAIYQSANGEQIYLEADGPALFAYSYKNYPDYDGWGYVQGIKGWNPTQYGVDTILMYGGKAYSKIIWANHDIFTDDGTLYFAKCGEPIPVYE